MNTVTKMYLVSEDQYKRHVLKPSITRRMLNKNLPTETKVKFINNMLARTKDQYLEPRTEYMDNQREPSESSEFESAFSHDPSNETLIDTKSDDTTLPISSPSRVAVEKVRYTPYPVSKKSDSEEKLTALIKSIPNLVHSNNKIINESGVPLNASSLSEIVNFCLSVGTRTKLPNGSKRVLAQLRTKYPNAISLIKNTKAIEFMEDIKWEDLTKN